jgi:hypothetical protein
MEEERERVETKASIEGATEHGQRKRGLNERVLEKFVK